MMKTHSLLDYCMVEYWNIEGEKRELYFALEFNLE